MRNTKQNITENAFCGPVTSALALGVICLLALMASCSGGSPGGNGSFNVYLTDAPLDLTGVNAVNVTVSEITLHTEEDSEGNRERLPLVGGEPWTVNLLDYRDGNTVLMASGDIPPGNYSKMRLHVIEAELAVDDDGDPLTPDVIEPIFNPSGKVDIPVPFSISAGEEMSVTLDFDAELSVQVNATNGQHPYILRPVINLVDVD